MVNPVKPIAIEKPKSAPFTKFYMYATSYDKCLIITGTVSGILGGLSLPIYNIIFGDLVNTMVTSTLTMSIARE